MYDGLKEALDQVRAEEALKERTRAFLWQKTRGYTRSVPPPGRRWIPAAACLLLLTVALWGGTWLYFTPTMEISVDINPSVELGVNRFDRVISVDGYNEDGQALARLLNVKYRDCEDAIQQILETDTVSTLLANDELLSIAVVGENDTQTARVLSQIEGCTAGVENVSCYAAHAEDVETAHALGLSCGKYRMYQELQALDPGITVEEVREMTMRELQTLKDRLEAGEDPAGQTGPGTQSGSAAQTGPAVQGGQAAQAAGNGSSWHHGEGSSGHEQEDCGTGRHGWD